MTVVLMKDAALPSEEERGEAQMAVAFLGPEVLRTPWHVFPDWLLWASTTPHHHLHPNQAAEVCSWRQMPEPGARNILAPTSS